MVDVLIKIELHQLADRLLQSEKKLSSLSSFWGAPQMMLKSIGAIEFCVHMIVTVYIYAGGPPVLTDMNTVPEHLLQLSCMPIER